MHIFIYKKEWVYIFIQILKIVHFWNQNNEWCITSSTLMIITIKIAFRRWHYIVSKDFSKSIYEAKIKPIMSKIFRTLIVLDCLLYPFSWNIVISIALVKENWYIDLLPSISTNHGWKKSLTTLFILVGFLSPCSLYMKSPFPF